MCKTRGSSCFAWAKMLQWLTVLPLWRGDSYCTVNHQIVRIPISMIFISLTVKTSHFKY